MARTGRLTAFTWTTDLPTVSGWYWYRKTKQGTQVFECAFRRGHHEGRLAKWTYRLGDGIARPLVRDQRSVSMRWSSKKPTTLDGSLYFK
ncbi:MAG: hypothetical protein ABI980_14450 [Nitrospirota bacterium]